MKALITDLDATILPYGGSICNSTLEKLEDLGKKGVVRILATGRSLFSVKRAVTENFPIDYLVFSSGAGIMDWHDKRMLNARHIPNIEAKEIAERLWNRRINFMAQGEIPENHRFYYTDIPPVHPDYTMRLDIFKEFGEYLESPEDIEGMVSEFIVVLDTRQIRIIGEIYELNREYSVIKTTSPHNTGALWLEIFPFGLSKGSACETLLSELGIDIRNECAGIGNDFNDVDFLRLCRKSAVVGNAAPALRKEFQTVSEDAEGGFLEFIRNIF